MRTALFAAAALAVIAVACSLAGAFVAAFEPQQIRRINADEFSRLFSTAISGAVLDGEDPESPALPWAVHFSLPWAPLNKSTSSSAFAKAAARFPKNTVRFAEFVVDTPEALAIADLFVLKLPGIQVVHGQQTRFDQLVGYGGLPFGDAPADVAGSVNGQSALVKNAAAATEVDIVRFVARSLPVTVFDKLDHTEMASVITLQTGSLDEAAALMREARQSKATIVAVQPPAASGTSGDKNAKRAAAAVKLGREWVQLATLSAGAQFVGRAGGLVFFVDGALVSDDAKAAALLGVSAETLAGSCEKPAAMKKKNTACFDVITVSLPSGDDEGDATATAAATATVERAQSGARDISLIQDSVRTLVLASSPKDEEGEATSAATAHYAKHVLARHSASRARYARVFEPLALSDDGTLTASHLIAQHKNNAKTPFAPKDTARPLVSTAQFRQELAQSKAGMFVAAFLRPSDRNFERHFKAVNELASLLYRNRNHGGGRGEMRYEVLYVDTDAYPSAAEGFGAVQVPSMFVVHHADDGKYAVAQFRGEFSFEKLKAMEVFVREKSFDQAALTQFRPEKVSFGESSTTTKKKKKVVSEIANTIDADEDGVVRHSFHVPYEKLTEKISKVLLMSVQSASLVVGKSAAAAAAADKPSTKKSEDKKATKKKKETPAEEAKRLKQEAAKAREQAQRKKEIEAELEKKRLAKEEKIAKKKAEMAARQQKLDDAKNAKLEQIKKEVQSGKRVKKITREDVRSKRQAALKKAAPRGFNVFRQDRIEAHLRREVGYVGQLYTTTVEGDGGEQQVKIKDELW